MIGVVSLFIIDKAPTIHGPVSPGQPGSSGWCPCWWGSSFGKAEYATSHGSCCFIWSQDSIVLNTQNWTGNCIFIRSSHRDSCFHCRFLACFTRVIRVRAQFAMMSSCIFLMCKTKSPRFPSAWAVLCLPSRATSKSSYATPVNVGVGGSKRNASGWWEPKRALTGKHLSCSEQASNGIVTSTKGSLQHDS